jgi:hypothetical protein
MSNVEYRIFVDVFCRQAQWKKIKTNIQNSTWKIDDMPRSFNWIGLKIWSCAVIG